MINLRVSAFICGCILLLIGCGPKHPPTPEPYRGPTESMYDVIQAINRNNNRLPTLWGSIAKMQISMVDEKNKRHDETLDGVLLYRSTRDVKVIGHDTLGGNVLEIGSNHENYWLIVRPGEDTAWWGRYKYLGDPRQACPVSPALVTQVLGVSTVSQDFNELPVPVMRFNNDSDAYMLIWNAKLPDRWVAVKEVWYDRATKRPIKVFLFDADGRIILNARLEKHKPVEVPDVPKENWPVVATDYRLTFPDSGSSLHLVLDDVRLRRGNVPNDKTFEFSPAKANVSTVIQLDEDCGP